MKNLIPIGKITSLISFLLGSIILLIYLLTKDTNIISIGIVYLSIAFIINSILLVVILIAALVDSSLRIELLKTCGIMLLNIPIAYGYFWIVVSQIM